MNPFADLEGRVALVTGASGGLGRHFAETLAAHGARVVLAARRIERLESVAAGIRERGGEALPVALDVRDPDRVPRAFDEAAAACGDITVVVNNSGVAVAKPALDQTEADWQQVVDTNLNGAWRVAQAAARHMRDHDQGGSIINIASIVGLRVAGHLPGYAASKAGLIHLTKSMALDLARYHIRVNAIAPGYIETDINRDFFRSPQGQALIKRIPQRRIGQPEHLDGALLLLASEASSFMTGSVLAVDGGHLSSSL